jgi:hypothetical protein
MLRAARPLLRPGSEKDIAREVVITAGCWTVSKGLDEGFLTLTDSHEQGEKIVGQRQRIAEDLMDLCGFATLREERKDYGEDSKSAD